MKLLLIVVLLCLTGCGFTDYHNKIVKDSKGNIYRVDHRIGDCYFLKVLDTAQLNRLFDMTKESK